MDAGGVVRQEIVTFGRWAEGHTIAAGARRRTDRAGQQLDHSMIRPEVGIKQIPLDLFYEESP